MEIALGLGSGIGLITFYASYPSTGSVSDEFVKMWRARVEPARPGPVPQPQAQCDGDYTVAVGKREIDTPDHRDRGVSKYSVRIYDGFVLHAGTEPRPISAGDELSIGGVSLRYERLIETSGLAGDDPMAHHGDRCGRN
jgi:hypothetical protein